MIRVVGEVDPLGKEGGGGMLFAELVYHGTFSV